MTVKVFDRAFLLALFALVFSSAGIAEQYKFSSVEIAPMSSLQLKNAALVSPELLTELSAEMGQAAELAHGEKKIEVLLIPLEKPKGQLSIRKSLRDRLGIKPGAVEVSLRLLSPSESSIKQFEKEIRIEALPGEPNLWPGIVLGAPHGDCDMYTGEIVQKATQLCGVPSVSAYGARISFLGRWIDVNRPLQRRPAPTYGILSYRDWTEEAVAVFQKYQQDVLSVGRRSDWKQGEVPLDFYLDFHGHDLSVTSDAGERIYRNVFECMARGFSLDEVRLLKAMFNKCVSEEYGEEAPLSYWGNLPGDREYEYAGYPASFFYSGLGARVYGVLASDVSSRGIHIESPDSMRINSAQRIRTARVLSNFMRIVKEELLPSSLGRQTLAPSDASGKQLDQWASVPGGEFVMGAPKGEGWSIEWPQHPVQLRAYEMKVTEATCGEYAQFINKSLESGEARIQDSRVYSKASGKLWCMLWPAGPLSMLELEKQGNPSNTPHIIWRQGREHHPVNYVTWYGAMAMAKANSATLPTEAQWEKAASWDPNTRRWYRTCISLPKFPLQVEATMMNSGNPTENCQPPSTSPVGAFNASQSPVGCYDMSGNVWEWTTDWLGNYSESEELLHDPTGPEHGTMKVVRGGGWDTSRWTATPSFRLGVSPDQALPNVGFRLVR